MAFRFVAIPVCGRFGLWAFRFVGVSVCGRFGLWPFRFWSFRFVAVMTINLPCPHMASLGQSELNNHFSSAI